jgi:hypothetical protein
MAHGDDVRLLQTRASASLAQKPFYCSCIQREQADRTEHMRLMYNAGVPRM